DDDGILHGRGGLSGGTPLERSSAKSRELRAGRESGGGADALEEAASRERGGQHGLPTATPLPGARPWPLHRQSPEIVGARVALDAATTMTSGGQRYPPA